MLEVEMKFAADDLAALEAKLAAWGARADAPRLDADHYFNAPDRDFARTDEALRIRRMGDANCVTYKGPKRDAQTKTRTEIEVPLGAGEQVAEQFAQLLTHLGYRAVAIVCKRRRVRHAERDGFPLEVCLDEVEGVGSFVEIEIMAPEERLDAAKAVVLKVAAELGLSGSERRSYLEMLLTNRAEKAP